MQVNLFGCAGGSWIGTGDEVALGDQMRCCWSECALGLQFGFGANWMCNYYDLGASSDFSLLLLLCWKIFNFSCFGPLLKIFSDTLCRYIDDFRRRLILFHTLDPWWFDLIHFKLCHWFAVVFKLDHFGTIGWFSGFSAHKRLRNQKIFRRFLETAYFP